MGRTARRDIEGGWHHVMNRGAARERIFFTKGDGEAFENLLAAGAARVGIEVHAYCLMPNHFHLLLHCPNGGLSTYMHRVGTHYSRRINARFGGDGPVFRSRFRSVLIDNPRYLAQAGSRCAPPRPSSWLRRTTSEQRCCERSRMTFASR